MIKELGWVALVIATIGLETTVLGKEVSMRTVRNLSYTDGTASAARSLDLYLTPKPRPLLVYVHGGAWVGGDKGEYAELGQAFTKQGISAAIVNYRLSPDVKHPAHAQDLAQALKWLARHAKEYGYTSDLYVAGHSAGAHMAAVLVTAPEFSGWAAGAEGPKGYIGLEGIYDLVALVKRWPGYRTWFMESAFGANQKEWVPASPTLTKVTHSAPWLVIHSSEDELVDVPQSTEFRDHLKKANVKVEYVEPKGRHFGVLEGLGTDGNPLTAAIVKFIKTKSRAVSETQAPRE